MDQACSKKYAEPLQEATRVYKVSQEVTMDLVNVLYHTRPGRILLKPLTSPAVSHLAGRLLDLPASAVLIPGFIRANHIRIQDYQETTYHSFNEFFCRKIKPQLRPVDMLPSHLIAPCDGLLRVYPITQDLVLPVKQSRFTISSLLRSHKIARMFDGGYCMVFRLCVDHYHRYCYPDDAVQSNEIRIPGIYHTVRPAALEAFPVFVENTREYCLLKTENFGTILQMEVGAMLVGRICNKHGPGPVKRGMEKGCFQYGGSTIILLVQKDQVHLTDTTPLREETPVRMGQMIAQKVTSVPPQ